MNTLILGMGNLLLCDEGVGVHVARALAQRDLPADVAVVEAGTAFLDVLPDIEKADRILLIDAMEGGGAPAACIGCPSTNACIRRCWLRCTASISPAFFLWPAAISRPRSRSSASNRLGSNGEPNSPL
jgi:hypothetical protein